MAPLVLFLPFLAQEQPAWKRFEEKVQAVSRKAIRAFVFVGGGSGAIIRPDGTFITNHHVAGSVDQLTVFLADGSRFLARKISADPMGDLALFRPDGTGDRKFEFLELGDSDALEQGEYVIAVGNPFNLGNFSVSGRHEPAVSLGIVSALRRRQGNYFEAIQTDAALNPGNSGGPLLNLRGQLVGINGRIAARFGNRVNSGVGFAIASNTIRRFLPKLLDPGPDRTVYHGTIPGLVLSAEHSDGKGAVVREVKKRTLADTVGLRPGDLIVEVDGRRVGSRNRLISIVGTYPEGARLRMGLLRGGERLELEVVLARAGPLQRPTGAGFLGVLFRDETDGVALAEVVPDSPAARAGLRVGDRILELDGVPHRTTESLLPDLWTRRPGDRIRLLVQRNAEKFEVEVELIPHPADRQ